MLISIVVRTKNERPWIGRCLQSLTLQRGCRSEIIVVDNESTDGTLDVVRQFDCRVMNISQSDYTHGKALNLGIAVSRGNLVAILSGHCIAVTDRWLLRLADSFRDPLVAGVYGRQEPLPESSDLDKRDLWTTFGLDRRVQIRDWFFHNANSMISRAVWEQVPFNETIDGVEDRDWAKRVQELGYRIVYEPSASAFHFHGIHQGADQRRAQRVARVIDLIRNGRT